MQDLIPINVVIGDRTYRIKIEPADEELVIRTLKTMNGIIIECKTQLTACSLPVFYYLRQLTHFHAIMNPNKKYMIVNALNFRLDDYRYCCRSYRISDRDHCR